jgi:hypothetical protein
VRDSIPPHPAASNEFLETRDTYVTISKLMPVMIVVVVMVVIVLVAPLPVLLLLLMAAPFVAFMPVVRVAFPLAVVRGLNAPLDILVTVIVIDPSVDGTTG